MKSKIQKAQERGGGDFGWLKTNYSFSFANYFNKDRMNFGALRVLNDDWIAPGAGFPDHSHKDMEIFTIPLSGRLRHNDSTGKESIITVGDIQIMSAGSGVTHGEFNDSYTDPVELLQVWITPNTAHLSPRHVDRFFPHHTEKNILHTIITPDGSNDTLKIHQDAYVHLGTFDTETTCTYKLHDHTHGIFVFVIEGEIVVDKEELKRRDSIEIIGVSDLTLSVSKGAELLLIEVPML
jgi:redox-sensitive bicupin YhaK (pirin superfamily)